MLLQIGTTPTLLSVLSYVCPHLLLLTAGVTMQLLGQLYIFSPGQILNAQVLRPEHEIGQGEEARLWGGEGQRQHRLTSA